MEAAPSPLANPETASRIARAIAATPGVESVTVSSAAGAALAQANSGAPAREAALASFVAGRAEALSADGDLRGMGRLVTDGRLLQVVAAWPGGEALILSAAGLHVFVAFKRGTSAESTSPGLRAILKRFG